MVRVGDDIDYGATGGGATTKVLGYSLRRPGGRRQHCGESGGLSDAQVPEGLLGLHGQPTLRRAGTRSLLRRVETAAAGEKAPLVPHRRRIDAHVDRLEAGFRFGQERGRPIALALERG